MQITLRLSGTLLGVEFRKTGRQFNESIREIPVKEGVELNWVVLRMDLCEEPELQRPREQTNRLVTSIVRANLHNQMQITFSPNNDTMSVTQL